MRIIEPSSVTDKDRILPMSPPQTQALIQLQAVGYHQGQRTILKGIELSLRPGKIISLIGPNGAGKSTLVKIIVGLLNPTQGQRKVDPTLRIGYMPQYVRLEPLLPLTVQRFLQLVPQAKLKDIQRALEEAGCRHLAQASIRSLSGGEWQWILWVRALLNRPQVLILDEPTQGMDLTAQATFFKTIVALRAEQQGSAVLMVTHDLHYVMAATDEVICLQGHICCQGHPDTVKQSPEFLALYHHQHDHSHEIRQPKGES